MLSGFKYVYWEKSVVNGDDMKEDKTDGEVEVVSIILEGKE